MVARCKSAWFIDVYELINTFKGFLRESWSEEEAQVEESIGSVWNAHQKLEIGDSVYGDVIQVLKRSY